MNLLNFRITLFVLILISLFSCSPDEFTCTLKGTVIDRDYSDTLMINRVTEDLRFVKNFVPIVDGKFEYQMDVKHVEAWEMTFQDEYYNGRMHPIDFFPDQEEVIFELYPEDQFKKNKVIGGKQNKDLAEYSSMRKEIFDVRYEPLRHIRDSLLKNGLYRSEESIQLIAQLRSTENQNEKDVIYRKMDAMRESGQDLTPIALENENKWKDVSKDVLEWRYEYISENPDILSYSYILHDLLRIKYSGVTLKDINELYPVFSEEFPDHPYTELIADIMNGTDKIKIGGRFVDFSLPDLSGNTLTLSELIDGKIAVIDLWATWCGPCIRHSRELVPVYDEYHDQGFTIVGVAAELDNTEAMEKRLDIEKWPWVNLVELDHQNNIWHKCGASFGGGKIIMVDQKGVIIAINPTAEEVKEKLEEVLQLQKRL